MEYFGQRVARRIAVSRRGANPFPISVSLEDMIMMGFPPKARFLRLAQNIEQKLSTFSR